MRPHLGPTLRLDMLNAIAVLGGRSRVWVVDTSLWMLTKSDCLFESIRLLPLASTSYFLQAVLLPLCSEVYDRLLH